MDKKYAAQEAITHSMMGSLGLKLIEEKEGFIRASMPGNDNTSQPFGVLCGGASLAFAEIIAGYGSYLCCPEEAKKLPPRGSWHRAAMTERVRLLAWRHRFRLNCEVHGFTRGSLSEDDFPRPGQILPAPGRNVTAGDKERNRCHRR